MLQNNNSTAKISAANFFINNPPAVQAVFDICSPCPLIGTFKKHDAISHFTGISLVFWSAAAGNTTEQPKGGAPIFQGGSALPMPEWRKRQFFCVNRETPAAILRHTIRLYSETSSFILKPDFRTGPGKNHSLVMRFF
jgi:hypothetical protein